MTIIRLPAMTNDAAASGLFNVRDFGAIGDGVADDTVAIQAAITAACTGTTLVNGTTYLPIGEYLISARLLTHRPTGLNASRQRLLGEDMVSTIIKLKDGCTGFNSVPTSPTTFYPRAMFRNGSSTVTGGADGGNNGFNNSIRNLTFDIGVGNPGACAIDHNGNNWDLLEDLILKSSDPAYAGHSLLYMGRGFPGPGYARNLSLSGTDFPIFLGQLEYSFTFEGLSISNARRAGIYDDRNVGIFKDFSYHGIAPAWQNKDSNGAIFMLDSTLTFTGEAPAPSEGASVVSRRARNLLLLAS